MDKTRAAMQQALGALVRAEAMYGQPNTDIQAALREALDHIAATGRLIPQFIPVGIVNDQHCITWMEEIVDDQAPIGAILYAKEQL